MKRFMLYLSCFILLLMVQSACGKITGDREPIKQSRFLMDTIVEITLYENATMSNKLIDELFREIQEFERKFNRYIPESEISIINRNANQDTPVSEDTLDLIEKSLFFSSVSNGLFDISIGPLVDLWDITGENPRVPAETEIHSVLEKVDFNDIAIDKEKGTVSVLKKGMALDAGAIAKGYVTDKLVQWLQNRDIQSALINLGGNLHLVGSKPDGSIWNIAIRDPFGTQGEYLGTVEVQNLSVVTSGIYERYFDSAGKRYHHLLNPNTGYPEDNNLAGVSILSPSSLLADGLSTTVFLLGLEKGMALVEEMDEAEAIIITKDKEVIFSSGIGEGKIPFYLLKEDYRIRSPID